MSLKIIGAVTELYLLLFAEVFPMTLSLLLLSNSNFNIVKLYTVEIVENSSSEIISSSRHDEISDDNFN